MRNINIKSTTQLWRTRCRSNERRSNVASDAVATSRCCNHYYRSDAEPVSLSEESKAVQDRQSCGRR